MSKMLMEKIAYLDSAFMDSLAGSFAPEARRKALAYKANKLHNKLDKTTDVAKQDKYKQRIEKLDSKIRKIDQRHGTGYMPAPAPQAQKTATNPTAAKPVSRRPKNWEHSSLGINNPEYLRKHGQRILSDLESQKQEITTRLDALNKQ